MANEAEKTGTGGKNGQNFWNGEQFLSLLFPRRCPVCGEIVLPRGELICPACVGKLTLVRQPVCMTCGKELESERQEYCVDCMRHPKTFRHNFALLRYDDVTRRSMAAIKYKNKREYLDFYGEAMARRFGRQLLRIRPDALVPVPVHRSRLRSRGFNQAQLLAERIGRRLDIPVCPQALIRTKKTLPQKKLSSAERLENIRKAFAPGILPEKTRRVVLIDDIYTTGSTLEACARVLRSMGVEEVYGMTICIGGAF